MSTVNGSMSQLSALLNRIDRNVPRALLDLPVWLLHTADKVPKYIDGRRRQGKLDSPEDRAKLVTFEEAAKASLVVHDVAGLGIALGPVAGTDIILAGIDLDHCYRNGELDGRAQEILTAAYTYAERSPSGQGLHVLGLGDIGTTKTQGLEIYSRGRFFTVTGDAFDACTELGEIGEAASVARRLFRLQPMTISKSAEHNAIPEGERNNFLTREAGKLRRINSDPALISATLHTVNQQYCVPPLDRTEVEQIAQGILRYPPHPEEKAAAGEVQLLRGTEFNPEPISWLWSGWLARGKLHVLAGAPGCGKTTLALAFTAILTAGRNWPDGSKAPTGNVAIWSGEDDFKDTLLPRLIAMGVDSKKVYFVGGVYTADGQQRPFDPARDMDSLSDKAREIGDISLLIVDPIVNAVAGDSHKNTETRRSLQPLVDFARQHNAAVLGVSHYTKGTHGRDPVERVTGSIAFGALPRIIMGAAKGSGEDRSAERILVRAKSNIGPDGGGYAYSVTQEELREFAGVVASSIVWGKPLDGSAQALLATAENGTDSGERTALSEAEAFLRAELADGRVPSRELMKRAREAGISERTLKRARRSMGVQRDKDGATGAWYCSLPPDFAPIVEEDLGCPTGILGTLGHLRSNQKEEGQGGQLGQGDQEGQEGHQNGVIPRPSFQPKPEAKNREPRVQETASEPKHVASRVLSIDGKRYF